MISTTAPAIIVSLLLFLSFLSSPLSVSARQRECNPHHQKAVDQIKAALGIIPTGDCCDGEIIICADAPPHGVTNIELFGSTASAPIPAAIGDLSSLLSITINNVSNLTGSIPPAITKLTKLISVRISYTGLSGPIPTFPVNLINLTTLDLSFNGLTGSLPPELSRRFPNLQVLTLESNKLTGTIPESFGHFPESLQFLSLSRNFLFGTIPRSLSNLDLYTINLSRNKFTGDASFLIGKNKRTIYLYLHKNYFSFDLSKVEFPTSLRGLKLNQNNISGGLPQQLTQFDFLSFNVSYNSLCGEIPQGGSLQHFGIPSYFHNKCLCGAPLPACNGKPSAM